MSVSEYESQSEYESESEHESESDDTMVATNVVSQGIYLMITYVRLLNYANTKNMMKFIK